MKVKELSAGQLATLACGLEVAAPKPGNVHRSADFSDTTFEDFLVSAQLLGHVVDATSGKSIGKSVYKAVEATAHVLNKNTNLGLILLIVPLAKLQQRGCSLTVVNMMNLLQELSPQDASDVFAAIRLAAPGGLGNVDEMDVSDSPPANLLDAMRVAAKRDLVAQQYSTGFQLVFETVVPYLIRSRKALSLRDAIVLCHIRLIANFGDSLIARKCGDAESNHAQFLAQKAVESFESGDDGRYLESLAEMDFWMRSDGNRRNPGTTADLVGAGLFVALANGKLKL